MFFREPVLSALRSSQSRDLHRLICRLLTSLSLFRFFPLSAFLLPSTRLSLSFSLSLSLSLFLFFSFSFVRLSRCRSLLDFPLCFCLSAISNPASRSNSLSACHALLHVLTPVSPLRHNPPPPPSHPPSLVYRFSAASGNPLFPTTHLPALLRLERILGVRCNGFSARNFRQFNY